MNFVNFWMRGIVLELGATACPLDLPDGEYRLVIADGLGAQAAAREIVGAVVAGGAATLTRGMEGTTDQDWPMGSVIYSSVTAGFLVQLQQQIADLLARVAALEAGGIPDNGGAPTSYEAIVRAGTVLEFTEHPGSVWANVELTESRTYTAAAPCFAHLRPAEGGDDLVAIFTPVTEYIPPAVEGGDY